MALTRKALKAMGLTDEQVDSIVEMHTETVDGLKNKADQYEADAKKLPGVQRELDDLKAAGDGGYKEKYEAEKAAHDKTKDDYAAKETTAKKAALYRTLLKDAGVDEKRLDAIMRLTDLNAVELDGDKLKNVEELTNGVKTEWADFIGEVTVEGATVNNPPGGSGGGKPDMGKMSMEEYIAARKKK